MPEIEPYTGETPFIEAAAAELGLPVHPGQVAAIPAFARLSSLVIQAVYAEPENRPGIARAAAAHLDVLAVADLAGRRIIAHLFESISLPVPVSEVDALRAKAVESEDLSAEAVELRLEVADLTERLASSRTAADAEESALRAKVAELERHLDELTAPAVIAPAPLADPKS